jgi:hypothetical protein
MKTLEGKRINLSMVNKTYPIVYDKNASLEIMFTNEKKLKITSFVVSNILPDYSGNIKVYIGDDVDFIKNLYDDCTFKIKTNIGTVARVYNFDEIDKIKDITRIEVELNYWNGKNVEPDISDHKKIETIFTIESR